MTTADGKTAKPKAAQILIGENALIVSERAKKRTEFYSSARLPEAYSGGRAIISVADATIAFVQSATWTVSVELEEIKTVDSILPWEIAVNQVRVRASLTQFVDPASSPESQLLFSNVQALLHQPLVFIEFFDKLGTKMFTSKGMFESINGSIGSASLATLSASFVGIGWATNTVQAFTPYEPEGILGRVGAALSSIKKLGF